MTEPTQREDAGRGNPGSDEVHTFDLIDEVPGASGRVSNPESDDRSDGPDEGAADRTGGATGDGDESDGEPAERPPGRIAMALTGARAAVRRTARRGGAAVRRRLPTTRRGKVLLVGGTAVVVVLAVVAGALVNAKLRERDLIAAPGGVRSLAERPTEQWSIDLENPTAGTLVEMPGVLAVVGDGKAYGVDPATGGRQWSIDVGDDATCGPTTGQGLGGPSVEAPADPLVCVATSEDGSAQVVTVIEPDGAATTREIGPDAMVVPAPDGGLLHLELTGGDQEVRALVTDKLGGPRLPKRFEGPDLVVRSEDAATGDGRWSETVAFGAPRPSSCVRYEGNEGNVPVLDVTSALGWDRRGDVLEVLGCGVSAAIRLDGTRLDDPDSPDDPPADGVETASFATLPDGGWVAPGNEITDSGTPNDVVHLPEAGAVPLAGRVLVPWTTDGGDPGLVLEQARRGTRAVSTDPDDAGRRVWTAPQLAPTALLAQASGTAVVVDEPGAVRAIDVGTGADRWTVDPDVLAFGDRAWAVESAVFGAYTDGDTLLLAATADLQGSRSGLRLLALDLDDGSLRWEIEQDTSYTQLISVDGYLAQITQQGVVGLG